MRSPWARIAVAIRDRHRGGDTVSELGRDYDIPEAVIVAVLAAKRATGATRALERWQAEKKEKQI